VSEHLDCGLSAACIVVLHHAVVQDNAAKDCSLGSKKGNEEPGQVHALVDLPMLGNMVPVDGREHHLLGRWRQGMQGLEGLLQEEQLRVPEELLVRDGAYYEVGRHI